MNEDTGTFVISIDDGFCEWSYSFELSKTLCILDILENISNALDVTVPDGKMRRWKKVAKK